ncbi:MAG TPA: preprotein translocase subunit YajC [Thermodesulfobacteriota bacterium]|nr:preprotein translocase subunit YajC [Thermodesulfobacteriota bacterium]
MNWFTGVAEAMGLPGGGSGGSGGGGFAGLIPLLLMFVIFYFLLIRPQQKKARQHKDLLANLKRGDSVITNGGIYGRIAEINDNVVVLEVADKVRIKVGRGFVSGLAGTGQEAPPQPAKPA